MSSTHQHNLVEIHAWGGLYLDAQSEGEWLTKTKPTWRQHWPDLEGLCLADGVALRMTL